MIDRCITEESCSFDENQLVDGGFLRLAAPPAQAEGLQPLPAQELKEEEVLPPAQETWLASNAQP